MWSPDERAGTQARPYMPAFAGMTKKNAPGYTLLELLLVILIASIIATLGILVYQQRTTDFKISQTVEQMQQLMEAASAYYVDNNCWPNSPQCAPGVLKFDQYVPLKNPDNPQNPWGGTYTFQIEPTYGKKFQIFSGVLPANIADRIVARLPNTTIGTNQAYVLAEISSLKKSFINSLTIATIGKTPVLGNGGNYSFTFSCPANWPGKLVLGYNYIKPSDFSYPAYHFSIGSYIIGILNGGEHDESGFCTSNNNGATDLYSCNVGVQAISYTGLVYSEHNLGNASFTYIGYCLNPSAPENKTKTFSLF